MPEAQLGIFSKQKAALAQMEDVQDVKQVKNIADAAHEFYKAQGDFETAQKAKELSMRSARRAGEILAQPHVAPRGRRWPDSNSSTLAELEISEYESKSWQQVARVPADTFEKYFVLCDTAGEEYTIAGLMRIAGEWYQRSDVVEWETPQWLFDLLDREFHFELDVCASDANAKCNRYFTKIDNGLAQRWEGTCWMNPPYGRGIENWMGKAKASAQSGSTVVCLVPARPDTEWWWDNCIESEIRFIKGRLKWPPNDTIAPFPSAVIIMRPNQEGKVVWWDVRSKQR